MARNLASIQRITDIQPIDGADRIEVASILGWKVVIKKGEFNIGDKVIYVEIDSVLPDVPEFEFLRERKFIVKTVKLRGCVSQGLILPTSILVDNSYCEGCVNHNLTFDSYCVGDDVTDILNITKFDNENAIEKSINNTQLNNNFIFKYFKRYKWFRKLFMTTVKKANFPSFIRKTDETRIQNIPNVLANYDETDFIVSEKLDGQSVTFYLKWNQRSLFGLGKKYKFGVCSRNMELEYPDNSSYWTIARIYNIEHALKQLIGKHDYVVLQGEIVGEKIQSNKYKVSGVDFYAFNLIYPHVQVSSTRAERLLKQHYIKFVPLIFLTYKLPKNMDEILEFAKGKSVICDTEREGIVVRNYDNTISFKVINNDFLIKHNI